MAENGGSAVKAGYGALTLADVAFFSHMIPGTQRGYAVAIDQGTNLATVFELWFSGYKDNREVQREIYYGYVEQPGQEAPKARHVTTNRAEGKGFYWKQDAGAETLEFYPSAAYSNFVELSRLGGELSFCAPSDYIKINDDRYIYTRTECEFSGTFTAYVMDLNRVEQVGVRLGFDANDALEYYVFRGKGEWLGQHRAVRKVRRRERLAGSSGRGRPDCKEGRPARLSPAPDHGENDQGRSRRRLRQTYVGLRTARHFARRQCARRIDGRQSRTDHRLARRKEFHSSLRPRARDGIPLRRRRNPATGAKKARQQLDQGALSGLRVDAGSDPCSATCWKASRIMTDTASSWISTRAW